LIEQLIWEWQDTLVCCPEFFLVPCAKMLERRRQIRGKKKETTNK
jgi:hypothetical protein